ncbi:MAG: hypothetical protein QOJ49_78, partial [Actinomycetota bacterium]|nr:hypothetical protein [Actinomycetota bacterium]
IAAAARVATIAQRVGSTTVQAETATTSGAAQVVVPASFWTGESLFGGTGDLALGNQARATLTVPAGDGRRLVLPVVDLMPGSTAVTTWSSGDTVLGQVASGAIGPQGASPALGALLPVTLDHVLAADATTLGVTTTASGSDVARIDAVILEPLVSRYVLSGGGAATALLRSASNGVSHTAVSVPGTGRAVIEVYDGSGRLLSSATSPARTVPVTVAPGGFTIVRRPG